MQVKDALTRDHVRIQNVHVSRAYFARLSQALDAFPAVIEAEIRSGGLDAADTAPLARHLSSLENAVAALSRKYLMSGQLEGALREELTIDAENSGFPVVHEMYMMAADAATAQADLLSFPDAEKMKAEMLREILTQARFPVQLQNMMARRQYHETLLRHPVFMPRVSPVARPADERPNEAAWMVDWAVYDSTLNVPVIYLLDLRDTGRVPMTMDPAVWPVLSHHLMSQSILTLSLDTIVKGIDRDFRRLHPTRLRRIVIGPFYANGFTVQNGAIQTALEKAGHDSWAMAATLESVSTEGSRTEGIFSRTELQNYGLPISQQTVLAPAKVFQSIQDHAKDNFASAAKYVLNPDGAVQRRG